MDHPLGLFLFGIIEQNDGWCGLVCDSSSLHRGGEMLTMEVAIADVTTDTCQQAALGHVLLCCLNDVGQSAHGHGYVSSPDMIVGTSPHRHDTPQSLLACAPQLLHLFHATGEFKGLARAAVDYFLHHANLLLNCRWGSSELEEDCGRLLPLTARRLTGIDALHLHIVQDLDSGHGDTRLHHVGDALSSIVDAGKASHGDVLTLRSHGQLQSGFRDKT